MCRQAVVVIAASKGEAAVTPTHVLRTPFAQVYGRDYWVGTGDVFPASEDVVF